jgi:hypothetical protein
MSTDTSIGPGPGKGGNEDTGNADGLGNKTLGEHSMPEPEIGSEAAPDVPAGVKGAKPNAGISKGPASYPDGPNVEASPWELDAARGKTPPER